MPIDGWPGEEHALLNEHNSQCSDRHNLQQLNHPSRSLHLVRRKPSAECAPTELQVQRVLEVQGVLVLEVQGVEEAIDVSSVLLDTEILVILVVLVVLMEKPLGPLEVLAILFDIPIQ